MSDTPAHLTLSPAQATAAQVRGLLERLGADHSLIVRVMPRADIEGRPYICVPPLPLDIVQRLLAALTADATGAAS